MDTTERTERIFQIMQKKGIARIFNAEVRYLDHNLNPVFKSTLHQYEEATRDIKTKFNNTLKGYQLTS